MVWSDENCLATKYTIVVLSGFNAYCVRNIYYLIIRTWLKEKTKWC